MTIDIRDYQEADAKALTDIFYDSIHAVAIEYYSPAEVLAWAPLPKDYAAWKQRFRQKPPYVAEIDGIVVGFMTLETNGHIDWTYTHKDYQRRGIAAALYVHVENEARKKGITRLFVEASHLAKPFFEKKGFRTVCRNEIERSGQTLINWSMERLFER